MVRIFTKPVTFGGPTTKGSHYWKFKNDIKEVFKNHKKIDSEFGIKIKLFLEKSRVGKDKNDLDNFLKPIIDALNEISIIEEHKMKSIKIERVLVDNSSEEGVDITFF
jgi:Holliday junction resolvase RusA-like endonuclease